MTRPPETEIPERHIKKGQWLSLAIVLTLIAACGPSKEQQRLAEKAEGRAGDCKNVGDKPFKASGKYVVWDRASHSLHSAHSLLDGSLKYSAGEGPVDVFLVSGKQSQQVGTYSISGQPALREWVDVCVVQFSSADDSGTPVAAHDVISLDPRSSRPVQNNPERGDPAPPIADWIRSLPRN